MRIQKIAIPLGPNLDLFKKVHVSEKGKLFPVFVDCLQNEVIQLMRIIVVHKILILTKRTLLFCLVQLAVVAPLVLFLKKHIKREFQLMRSRSYDKK